MSVSADFPSKLCLKRTTMAVKKVFGMVDVTENFFTWEIPNFQKLKKNVTYWNKSIVLDWTFTITKKNNHYIVTACPDRYNQDMECRVCYNGQVFSKPIFTDTIREGVYSFKVPVNIIFVKVNEHLAKDLSVFVFRFNKIYDDIKPMLLKPKDIEYRNDEELLQELFSSSKSHHYADFRIVSNKEESYVSVSKSILAARSRYLRNYLQENYPDKKGQIMVDATYRSMAQIMTFLYIGHAVMTTREQLRQVLDLAEELGLTNLRLMGEKYVQNYINRVYDRDRYLLQN